MHLLVSFVLLISALVVSSGKPAWAEGCERSLISSINSLLSNPERLQEVFPVTDIGPVIEPTSASLKSLIADVWTRKAWSLETEISNEEFEALSKKLALRESELMVALAGYASGYSHPPISEYPVGVAARTDTGSVIFGVNLEVAGEPLNRTIHGEQFVIARAHALGRTIKKIALSAAPCGHCRQFINETYQADQIRLHFPHMASNLPFPLFLWSAFGPQDLGIAEGALLNHGRRELQLGRSRPTQLMKQALDAAERSYAPYTEAHAGVAIELADGNVITGSYLENVAFNPSSNPISNAFVNMWAEYSEWAKSPLDKRGSFLTRYPEIKKVVLAETKMRQSSSTELKQIPGHEADTLSILGAVAPEAQFQLVRVYSAP